MYVKDIHSVEFYKTHLISSNNVPFLFFFFTLFFPNIVLFLGGRRGAKICSVAPEKRSGSGQSGEEEVVYYAVPF